MTETSTQAAPAPLQVRVREAEEDILKMAWTMASCQRTAGREHYAGKLRQAVRAALDLSTPTQIDWPHLLAEAETEHRRLEAENVKLRAELETRSRGTVMYQRAKRAEADVARLTEALTFYADPANWTSEDQVNIHELFDVAMGDDLGKRARDTLAALKGSTDAQA